ncbi:uncharacterized protein [Miscanthus floridulus]|uniref:uncharacterized protein n=1 Tax=Miscanthus floridulus TaxID=154761 RepID=UPI00345B1B94
MDLVYFLHGFGLFPPWICLFPPVHSYELHGFGRPPTEAPIILRIDRKHLFALATQELGLSVQTEKTMQIGDKFITVIEIVSTEASTWLEQGNKQVYALLRRNIKALGISFHSLLRKMDPLS